jgi:hypothetical protein
VALTGLFGGLKLNDREKTVLPVVAVLLVLAAILRTQPHLSNSTPFFALSILVGFALGRNRVGLASVLSVAAMFIADLVIGLHWTMLFVYTGVVMAPLVGALGSEFVLKRQSWLGRGFAAFVMSGLASTLFFVISNLGVWLVGIDSGLAMYPMTFAGLVECFTLAIPFFTRSLGADLAYGTSFVLIAARLMLPQTIFQTQTSLEVIVKK